MMPTQVTIAGACIELIIYSLRISKLSLTHYFSRSFMTDSSDKSRLFLEIEAERSYLIRFALAKLRDQSDAEEVVQEALLSALNGVAGFSGESSLRTWMTSILKFKIVDFQRRIVTERSRFCETPAQSEIDGDEWFDQLFDETGHWHETFTPWAAPDAAHEQKAFFEALEKCMDKLPPTTSRVFFQREVLGTDTEEICKDEAITPSNCWVILHRARLSLRECLEHNWFGNRNAA
jgi:RNA polymerase sigma-70 factor, ECF subfamily